MEDEDEGPLPEDDIDDSSGVYPDSSSKGGASDLLMRYRYICAMLDLVMRTLNPG